MLNVFSKGRRKPYDCFTIEVRLKNRTLWGYRSTYPYSQREGVPLPRVSAQPRATEFLWQKFSAIFSTTISLRKFPSSPQTKIWLLWQFPFPLCYETFTPTLMRNLHVLRSDKQTCGHDLKKSGEKASKYKSEGNFSHIKKLLITCEILAW